MAGWGERRGGWVCLYECQSVAVSAGLELWGGREGVSGGGAEMQVTGGGDKDYEFV